VRNLAEMKKLRSRAGRAIWSRTFAAIRHVAQGDAYNEVYNAIQNGVISAGENEAAGVESMKFYEVGPNLSIPSTRSRPADLLFRENFPQPAADLRAAIIRRGKRRAPNAARSSPSEDTASWRRWEKAGKLKRITFTDRRR